MKIGLTSILLAALALVLSSCATTPSLSGAKAYPLKVCLVTGNDLNSMGDEQVVTYEGRVLKFCCEPCVAKFHKNPAKYLAKLP